MPNYNRKNCREKQVIQLPTAHFPRTKAVSRMKCMKMAATCCAWKFVQVSTSERKRDSSKNWKLRRGKIDLLSLRYCPGLRGTTYLSQLPAFLYSRCIARYATTFLLLSDFHLSLWIRVSRKIYVCTMFAIARVLLLSEECIRELAIQ